MFYPILLWWLIYFRSCISSEIATKDTGESTGNTFVIGPGPQLQALIKFHTMKAPAGTSGSDADREQSLGRKEDRRQHIKKRNTNTFRSCYVGSAFA